MSVSGAWAEAMFKSDVGTIGTTETFDKVQKFDPPAHLMALPLLRNVSMGDDDARVIAYISEYVDGGKKHTGKFMGIVAESCTKIVWTVLCDCSFANPTRFILFFE
jgi:hypothetical protein